MDLAGNGMHEYVGYVVFVWVVALFDGFTTLVCGSAVSNVPKAGLGGMGL